MPRETLLQSHGYQPYAVPRLREGSILSHEVNISVPEESNSSKQDKISSFGKRQFQTLKKRTELTWMNEVALKPWP